MKVLLINGSPRPHGCTYTALSEVAGELEKAGIRTYDLIQDDSGFWLIIRK